MFDAEIEQKYLRDALKDLSASVGDNSTYSNNNCINVELKVTDSGAMIAELSTTDGNQYTIRHIPLHSTNLSLPAEGDDGMPLVNFTRFKSIVESSNVIGMLSINELKNGHLSVQDNNWNTPVEMSTMGRSFFPAPELTGEGESVYIDTGLIENALKLACPIIQEKSPSANPMLKCVYIEVENNDITILAMDSINNTVLQFNGKTTYVNKKANFSIEAKALNKAIKLFEDYSTIEITVGTNVTKLVGMDPNSLTYKNANVGTITAPDGSATIPSYDEEFTIIHYIRNFGALFPMTISTLFDNMASSTFAEISRYELMAALNKAKALVDDSLVASNKVTMSIDDDDVSIKSESAYGKVDEQFTIKNTGGFNGNSLKNNFKIPVLETILKAVDYYGDDFCIGDAGNPNSKVQQFIIKGSTYNYLVLGML